MRYHGECFSGYADPRSQASSSFHWGKHAGSQFEAAPGKKAGSKMRSARHFETGGSARTLHGGGQGGGGGGGGGEGGGAKLMNMGGSNGFGAKSSRGVGAALAAVVERDDSRSDGGGLSEAMLDQHIAASSSGVSKKVDVGAFLKEQCKETG